MKELEADTQRLQALEETQVAQVEDRPSGTSLHGANCRKSQQSSLQSRNSFGCPGLLVDSACC